MGRLVRLVRLWRRDRGVRPRREDDLREQRSLRQPGLHQRLRMGRLRAEGRRWLLVSLSGAHRLRQQLQMRHRVERRQVAILHIVLPLERQLGNLFAGKL